MKRTALATSLSRALFCVALLPAGFASAQQVAPDGGNANNLTSQRTSDLGGGATFYDCRVQVERA